MYEDVGSEFFHRNPASVYEHAWDLVVAGNTREESENGDKN